MQWDRRWWKPAGLIGSEPGQGVLDDSVLDSRSTELIAKLGILRDGDALVVYKNSRSSVLNFLRQSINDGFLAFKYLCVGHECHL